MEFSNNSTVSIRFLVFPNQQELVLPFQLNSTFGEIKAKLFDQKEKIAMKELGSSQQMRFIHSGRIIPDSQSLLDLHNNCKEKHQLTIHVVINKQAVTSTQTVAIPTNQTPQIPTNQNNNSNTPNSSPTPQDLEEWGRSIHFHGCFFHEEEAEDMQVVFEKKKSADGLMQFTDVHMFLRSYWKWMAKNKHNNEVEKFPMERMMEVKKNRNRIPIKSSS